MTVKLLKRKDVLDRTALSKTMLGNLVRFGKFPRPVNTTTRGLAWPEADVIAWIEARIAERGNHADQ
jgi:prophage regulatory protein